jgi:hypothetical protein
MTDCPKGTWKVEMTEDNDSRGMTPGKKEARQRTGRTSSGRLEPDVQKRIGAQLRAMYTDVVNEGVPDRFLELIQKLDKQEKM